jgi:hypothetical protein
MYGPFLAGVVADRTGCRKALRWSLFVNAIGVATPLFFNPRLGTGAVIGRDWEHGFRNRASCRRARDELVSHSRRQLLWSWMTASFSVAYAGNAYLFSFRFSRNRLVSASVLDRRGGYARRVRT